MLKFLLKHKKTLLFILGTLLLITTFGNHVISNNTNNNNKIQNSNHLFIDPNLNHIRRDDLIKPLQPTATPAPKPRQTYNLNKYYTNLLDCTKDYNPWHDSQKVEPISNLDRYFEKAPNVTHKLRIVRAVLVITNTICFLSLSFNEAKNLFKLKQNYYRSFSPSRAWITSCPSSSGCIAAGLRCRSMSPSIGAQTLSFSSKKRPISFKTKSFSSTSSTARLTTCDQAIQICPCAPLSTLCRCKSGRI